jgi:hypothetical protein
MPVEDLPEDALEFLLASRYCESDRLSDIAWSIFGDIPPGCERVQAICDYVHGRLTSAIPMPAQRARPGKDTRNGYASAATLLI